MAELPGEEPVTVLTGSGFTLLASPVKVHQQLRLEPVGSLPVPESGASGGATSLLAAASRLPAQ